MSGLPYKVWFRIPDHRHYGEWMFDVAFATRTGAERYIEQCKAKLEEPVEYDIRPQF